MQRRRRIATALLVFVMAAPALLSRTASAQAPAAAPAPAQDAANESEYKELVRAALAEVDARRFEEARALFLRAHALSPSARTLRALGNVEFELRHYVRSVHYLRAALDSREHPLTPEMQAEAQQALMRAVAYTGRFALELQPASAVLSIDGEAPEREADGALLLDIGRQDLVLAAPGYATQHKLVTVRGGENERLQIALAPSEVAGASSAPGAASTTGATQNDSASDSNLLHKWWFWTAIGVVAAGTVTGIAIAASAGTDTQAPLKGNLGESRMLLRLAP